VTDGRTTLRLHKARGGQIRDEGRGFVIILGVILLILGLLLDVYILWIIGIILAVVGGVLWLLGSMDRKVGPRKHYY